MGLQMELQILRYETNITIQENLILKEQIKKLQARNKILPSVSSASPSTLLSSPSSSATTSTEQIKSKD